ncbi:MAG TPA: aminotransferase class I/II-fold pyridoxal phosphate-dependent enzyme [Pyrinomonadaceae bacterium]|jgi:cystathionine beta-lyase/cystathionine gamma-synthase|nr:aminotransferase class I/II-fold pyridoxal phosphate-dependent enzyme [Pyrinomonadaceae bacterium]
MASQKPGEKVSRSQATIAVHGGQWPDESPFGAVVAPVFHSSTFSFKSFDEMRRYAAGELPGRFFYSRYANPTVAEVERKIAELEGAESCVVTASGSAATFATLVALCESGDEVIASDSIYGGTVKILTKVLSRYGVGARFISLDEIYKLPALVNDRTRVLWFESPANPINRVVDLARAAEVAREAKVFSVVDNTFATPILQKPISHGIDAVMHSATKYLGGHSDLTAGAIAGSSKFIEKVREIAVAVGATLDPAAAYLLGRGIRTLDLRVRTACENAMRLARALSNHKKVTRVYYPGLEDDPGHSLAMRQMSAFGGVVAMDIAGGEPEVEKFYNALRMARPAPSLGGVETLVSYPLYSSHAGFSDEQLRAAGVSAATVRLAVGIEAAEDIIADVSQALDLI